MFGRVKGAVSWVGKKVVWPVVATYIALSRILTSAGQSKFNQERIDKYLAITNGTTSGAMTAVTIATTSLIMAYTRVPPLYSLLDQEPTPSDTSKDFWHLNKKGKAAYVPILVLNVGSGFFMSFNMYFFTTKLLPLLASSYNFIASWLTGKDDNINDNDVQSLADKLGWSFALTNLIVYLVWNLKTAHDNTVKSLHRFQNSEPFDKKNIVPGLLSVPGIIPIPIFSYISTEATLKKISETFSPNFVMATASISATCATVAFLTTPLPKFFDYSLSLVSKNTESYEMPTTTRYKINQKVFLTVLAFNFVSIVLSNLTSVATFKDDSEAQYHPGVIGGSLLCGLSTAAIFSALDYFSFMYNNRVRTPIEPRVVITDVESAISRNPINTSEVTPLLPKKESTSCLKSVLSFFAKTTPNNIKSDFSSYLPSPNN